MTQDLKQVDKDIKSLADGFFVMVTFLLSATTVILFGYSIIAWDSSYAAWGLVPLLLIGYLLVEKTRQEKGHCYRCDEMKEKR